MKRWITALLLSISGISWGQAVLRQQTNSPADLESPSAAIVGTYAAITATAPASLQCGDTGWATDQKEWYSWNCGTSIWSLIASNGASVSYGAVTFIASPGQPVTTGIAGGTTINFNGSAVTNLGGSSGEVLLTGASPWVGNDVPYIGCGSYEIFDNGENYFEIAAFPFPGSPNAGIMSMDQAGRVIFGNNGAHGSNRTCEFEAWGYYAVNPVLAGRGVQGQTGDLLDLSISDQPIGQSSPGTIMAEVNAAGVVAATGYSVMPTPGTSPTPGYSGSVTLNINPSGTPTPSIFTYYGGLLINHVP